MQAKENMAAKVLGRDRAKTLDDALLRVVSNFGNVYDLTKQQSAAIKSFASGNDTFVSLPTGHGKSLIYQLGIPLAKELKKHSELWFSIPTSPMLLVVSPLTALIEDQMRSCEVFGLKCVKLEEFKEGDSVDLLFSSPETWEKQYECLSNLNDNIFGVVIDESHCVVTWGTGSRGQAPFRAAYSRVGNIKAILKVPMLCLTATASTKLRKKIIKMLNMTAVKTIRMSPEKSNVKYVVEKAKSELQDTFGWLISDMVDNAHAEKTIIFCQSLKACGDIYDIFQHFLPCKSRVAMYHSKTPQDIKDNVLSDLMSPNGNIHLVIATSALGMGVNIPNVKRVVIFGVPENMEAYLQAVGRGGRDGSDVLSIMFYHAYHLCHCDPTMRAFVKNKVNCRRGEILQFFNEKTEKPPILHKCCDVCSKQCNCGACPEEMFTICSELDNCPCTLERQVSADERETFTEVLKDLAVTCEGNISVFGSVCFQDVLADAIVSDVAADLEHLFTIDYILQNFPIFHEKLAAEILMVVNAIFNDVEETTRMKELCELDWSDCEEFLLSIPEQCPPDSDESDCDL